MKTATPNTLDPAQPQRVARPNLVPTTRGKIAALGATALLMLGVHTAGREFIGIIGSATGPEYTHQELDDMRQRTITVTSPGQGAQTMVESVNPGFKDGHDQQGEYDTVGYVSEQAGKDGLFDPNQKVEVPKVPGEEADK